jgi:integral membrane protein (TIGR01906 family)
MNSNLNRLARWIITLSLPLFLILSTLYVFFTEAYIRYEYSKPGFPPALNFSAEDRYRNSVESMRFVLGQRTLGQFVGLGIYNEREISHMVDVQRVVSGALLAHAAAGILLIIALAFLLRTKGTRVIAYDGLLTGSVLTLILISVIGIFSATSFDQFFVVFHSLFFTGDTWLFPATDSLIQLYPIEFWEDTSYAVAILSVLGALVIGGIALSLKWRARSERVNLVEVRSK